MKKFQIMEKLREFKCSLSRSRTKSPPPRPITRLRATARRVAPSVLDDYDDDQPTTKLSSAFIVVLILHIVAVGGIFAFKGIKAHRLAHEIPVASSKSHAVPAAPRVAATAPAAERETPSGGVTTAPVASHPAPPAAPPAQKTYKAHGGETLIKVAAQYGLSPGELGLPNGLSTGAVLRAGQTIVIPATKSAAKATAAAPTTPDAKKAAFLEAHKDDAALLKTTPTTSKGTTLSKSTAKSYTVAKNDTLTSIARKNGVTVEALMKANKIEDPKKLQLNQQLQIPAKKSE